MNIYHLETDRITIDSCRSHLHDQIFLLRPPEYDKHHPKWPGSVGIELEMLPVHLTNGEQPSPLAIFGPAPSILESVLNKANNQSWRWEGEKSADGQQYITRIFLESGDNLSFEPGGQFEISTLPYACLSDAVRRVREIQQSIDAAIAGSPEIGITQIGIQPWQGVEGIGLQLPKKRYRAMNDYFKTIGPYGAKMMRQTCTVQVCIDFGDSDTSTAERYVAAQLLSPFATALFAFSSVDGGNVAERKCMRRKVWAETDPSRAGLVLPDRLLMNPCKETCVEAYLEFLLNAKVIFIEKLGYEVPANLTFATWIREGYKEVYPSLADLRLHLSLLFPEVRPRGFLEIRSIDCQSRAWQFVPAAFYLGLLYDRRNLSDVLELLIARADEMPSLMLSAERGLDDPGISETAKILFQKAIDGFNRLPSCFRGEGVERAFVNYFRYFTEARRTPADDLLDAFHSQGLAWRDLQRLEDRWITEAAR